MRLYVRNAGSEKKKKRRKMHAWGRFFSPTSVVDCRHRETPRLWNRGKI